MLRRGALAALVLILAAVAFLRIQGDEDPQVRDAEDVFAQFSFPDGRLVRTVDSEAGPVSFYVESAADELAVEPPPDAVEEPDGTYLAFFRVPNPSGEGRPCNVGVDNAQPEEDSDLNLFRVGVFC